jgi:integrase/recombinase XerD
MKYRFSSVLAPTIVRYLSLKESLGRAYRVEHDVLAHLDTFLSSAGQDLASGTFQRWISTRSHLASGVRRAYMRIVRNLCLYRRRTESGCFVPDPSQFPIPHQAVKPYIFRESEIAHLLAETRHLRPGNRSPLRRQNTLLGLILLYTAGLRRGELLRLTLRDCDLSEGTLLVRESKFHKSRLLPLSHDALHAIEVLLRQRRAKRLPLDPESPLLWSGYGSGMYSGVGFAENIQGLLRKCGIRTAAGRLPRVHDFRHTFAVHALLRWYRDGKDVQTKLPALAAYMGHVSIVSTEHYLHFVDELAAVASERFQSRCGTLIRPRQGEARCRGQS